MKYHRRKHRDRISHERWLVSYADFITLLFAFFVVMYSAAQVDRRKVSELAAAIQIAFQQMGALPAPASQLPESIAIAVAPPPSASPEWARSSGAELAALQQELEQALAREIKEGKVAIRNGPDGLVISLREIGFFDSGSAGIKPGAQAAFDRIAELLTERPYRVRIEGHTDNVPIHTAQYPSNWELSTARATELVRLLIVKYEFAPERLSAAGYAEFHPIADNDTDQGRAQNRRVDVVVLRKQAADGNATAQNPSAKPSPSIPK